VGTLDDFLQGHARGGLLPGEQVLGLLHVREPTSFNGFGVPSAYTQWLGVATSTRLVLFRTELSFGGDPEPRADATLIWPYDEIARVAQGSVEGLTSAKYFTLVPHPTLGPRGGESTRLDVWPTAARLDDHARTAATFPAWLERQVASGAFPLSPAKRAAIEAKQAAERAATAERVRRQNQAIDGAIAAAKPHVMPAAVFLTLLGVGIVSGMVAAHGFDTWASASKPYRDPLVLSAERNLGDIRAGKRPFEDGCAYDKIPGCDQCMQMTSKRGWLSVKDLAGADWVCPPVSYYEARLATVRAARAADEKRAAADRASTAITGMATAIVATLVLLGTLGVGLFLFARNRARRAATAS
jgi:hypothetical protein